MRDSELSRGGGSATSERSRSARRLVAMASSGTLVALALAGAATVPASATTTVPIANGTSWDIEDSSKGSSGSGISINGGIDGFGGLRLRVLDHRKVLVENRLVEELGLTFDGADSFATTHSQRYGGIAVDRAIKVLPSANAVRYADTLFNTSDKRLTVEVVWGGSTGSDGTPGWGRVAGSSDGDQVAEPGDEWVTWMTDADNSLADPATGPSSKAPLAHVPGPMVDSLGNTEYNPFDEDYPGRVASFIGYRYRVDLAPHGAATLVNFMVKGRPETGSVAAGSQIAAVTAQASALAAAPDLSGLSTPVLCSLANWDIASVAPGVSCRRAKTPGPVPEASPVVPLRTSSRYPVVGKSIAQLQADMRRGRTTSEEITQAYLDRIAAYNHSGPYLNAFIAVSSSALEEARKIDRLRARGVDLGPLMGIPYAVKDNIDVLGLPTTYGTLALRGYMPDRDTFQIARLRAAGAIAIGKTNLDEWASSGTRSRSGTGGVARNPYALDRATGGSSGGSGAATAASLAAFTIGTDNYSSTRHPSANNSAVTMLPTRELSTNAGIMGSANQNHIAPITRTAEDLATVMKVTVVDNPDDTWFDLADERAPDYSALMDRGALAGKRIGVVTQAWTNGLHLGCSPGEEESGSEEKAVFDRVVTRLESAGATVVPVEQPQAICDEFGASGPTDSSIVSTYLNEKYVAEHPNFPFATYGAARMSSLNNSPSSNSPAPPTAEAYAAARQANLDQRNAYRAAIQAYMDEAGVDVLMMPRNKADMPFNDAQSWNGRTFTGPASVGGMPEMVVPAGYTAHDLPFGVSFIGRAFDDAEVFSISYATEQLLHARVEPASVPELKLAHRPDKGERDKPGRKDKPGRRP